MSPAGRGQPPDPYGDAVRRRFRETPHAGDPEPGTGNVLLAQASDGAGGAYVRLAVVTDGRRVLAMRYRVYGCPHLIAALERCCERFEGAPLSSLAEFTLAELMAELAVPVEKTGRMLLIEDVIRSIAGQAGGTGRPQDRHQS